MKFHLKTQEFKADRAWDALDIARIEGASVRLHWTNEPYIWHVNDGSEVFLVVDGAVDMHYRQDGMENVERMAAGDVCHAEPGDEHLARPIGEARILVIEKAGSI